MIKAERLFAGFLVILGIVCLIGSWNLPVTAMREIPGPGLMPRGLCVLLIVLAGWYLAYLWFKPAKTAKEFTTSYALKRQALLAGSLIASLFLTYAFGMLISLGLFIVLMLATIEKISWYKSTLVGFATILAVHLVFERWMGLQLIKGLLFSGG